MSTLSVPTIDTVPAIQVFPNSFRFARQAPARTFQLGEVLVRQGILSKSQLHRALQVQALQNKNRQTLGEILTTEDIITDQELKTALREQFWRNNGFWVID